MTPFSQTQHPAFDLGLPKWPQMLVWGKSVTVEQAQEIILRTDTFLTDLGEYSGGNNRRWNKWARDQFGITAARVFLDGLPNHQKWRMESRMQEIVNEALGCISTEYVRNSWASCAYVFGPHGWCHPDGTLAYSDNVGKWPSVESVCQEWSALAAAFPYLNLTVTLMNQEQGDEDAHEPAAPVVSLCVMDGQVYILDAPVMPPDIPPARDIETAVKGIFLAGREQGLSNETIEAYAPRIKEAVDKAFGVAVQELKAENEAAQAE